MLKHTKFALTVGKKASLVNFEMTFLCSGHSRGFYAWHSAGLFEEVVSLLIPLGLVVRIRSMF